MVIKISDEQISIAFAKISKDIKVILTSEIVKEELQEALGEYTTNKENESLFFREILAVVLSLSSKKDFLEKTEGIFDISTTNAKELVMKAENIVFNRIKKVQEGMSSDYLNIDNNIDHFSNNSQYLLDLPKEHLDKLEGGDNLDYDNYFFLKSEKTTF